MKFRKNKLRASNLPTSGRKSHKKLWISLSVFGVILLLPVLLLGWMGLVPGLSNLMGAANPKDLGVRYGQTNVNTYKQKTSLRFIDYSLAPTNPANPNEKQLLTNLISVSQLNLTQEEVTAAISSNNWSWMPANRVQARFSDNIIEVSGSLDVDKIENFRQYISGNNSLDSDATNAINWAKRLRNNAPVYIKANVNIVNNNLTFTLLQAQIGRLNIPLGSLGADLKNGTSAKINSQYFSSTSTKLIPGNLEFTGTYPTTIYVKP